MNITPHLGIGDLLIIKMMQISHNLDINNININKNLILTYSENYEVRIQFITKLVEFLFPDTNYCINNETINFDQFINNHNITRLYIYNYINNNNNNNIINVKNKYSDYIVFHTKMRYDVLMDKFTNEILPELNIFFKNFKKNYSFRREKYRRK